MRGKVCYSFAPYFFELFSEKKHKFAFRKQKNL